MRNAGRPLARGFTLLELLVALALAVLLFAALSAALYQVGESLERSEQVRARSERLALVENLLRRKIEGLQPLGVIIDGSATIWFRGNETTLEWVSAMPEHPLHPGLYHLRLAFLPERGVLQLALTPWQENALPDWSNAETVSLLEGVARAQWRYQPHHSEQWRTEWNEAEFHPARVALELTMAAGNRISWTFVLPRAR